MRNACLVLAVLLAAGLLAPSPALAFEAPKPDHGPVALWPEGAPGEREGEVGPEKATPSKPGEKQVLRIANVTEPTVEVYRPGASADTGAAVVVCPGGGYHILAWDLEGTEVCRWLNSIGVTGVLLKYRVPRRKGRPAHGAPLQDAQRALRLVRARAKEWGIDPGRVGILGFSAGGHLAAAASTNYDTKTYEAADDADALSARPDFTLLIYPAYLVNDEKAEDPAVSEELAVTKETPPTILFMTADDRFVNGALTYYRALWRAKVPAELHVYPSGGHGYGLRPSEHAVSSWPKRCEDWMRGLGVLKR
jgi:acetyl esterase/lipase